MKYESHEPNIPLIASGVAVGFVGLIVLWGSWYTIDQGERGVILRNGAVTGTAEPGLHFKAPLIDSVRYITTQDFNMQFKAVQAYSKDQQPAALRVSVTAKVTDPVAVYSNYGSLDGLRDRTISPRTYQQVENIFGQYDAIRAVQERVQLGVDAVAAIRASLSQVPVEIISVQIENIDFSDSYEKAVEARMQAVVQQQQAEAQKAKRITDADASAYEVRAAADAAAHRIDVVSTAEATAIQKRGDALKANPGLVSLTTAEKWNGVLPTTMVPGGAVPFISTGKPQ